MQKTHLTVSRWVDISGQEQLSATSMGTATTKAGWRKCCFCSSSGELY